MIGKDFSHYTILDHLGEGGMGIVYRARDARLNRDVAIKFLPRHIASREADRERFKIEAQAAAALSHPNIATIHAIEEADGEMFIVMELVEGHELKERTSRGPLPLDEALRIAIQIADGLQAAHRKSIVHRDIKSGNIMLSEAGGVKIMDFGLAKVGAGTHVTKADSTVGTTAYMSPEQARGEEVDARSDLWSLGVVLYEMLTGHLPFETRYEHATIYSILNEDPKPVTQLRPDVPESVAKAVHRALEKDPSIRYQSAEELIADLRSATMGPSTTVDRPRTLGARMRKPAFWIPAVALLVAFAALLAWWIQRTTGMRWAREEAIPEIERLVQDGTATDGLAAWSAFELAVRAEQPLPDDPLLSRLFPRFSRPVRFHSMPPGASVFAKPYARPESEWRLIGQTPIDSVRFPLGFSRVKLELAGHQTLYDVIWNSGMFTDTLQYQLSVLGSLPPEMEAAPKYASWYNITVAPAALHMPGLEDYEPLDVGDFLIDRHEVTNAEFKKFIEAGGYGKQEFWKHPITLDGRRLEWAEAMRLFADGTGQHGPSTWEVGDFPAGRETYPVTGVSWYEAAAYAEFAGKALPTIYHWDRVAFTWASPVIVPRSNLRSDGPRPVGSSQAMNRFGVQDLGGNAREWCFNESNRGEVHPRRWLE